MGALMIISRSPRSSTGSIGLPWACRNPLLLSFVAVVLPLVHSAFGGGRAILPERSERACAVDSAVRHTYLVSVRAIAIEEAPWLMS
jgi:hypothetical protein